MPYSDADFYDRDVEAAIGPFQADLCPTIEGVAPVFPELGQNTIFVCDDEEDRGDQVRANRLYFIDRRLDEKRAMNRSLQKRLVRDMKPSCPERLKLPHHYTNQKLVQDVNRMKGKHLSKKLMNAREEDWDPRTRFQMQEYKRQLSNRLLWDALSWTILPGWLVEDGRMPMRMVVSPFFTLYIIPSRYMAATLEAIKTLLASVGEYKVKEWDTMYMTEITIVIPQDAWIAHTIEPSKEWIMAYPRDRDVFMNDFETYKRTTRGDAAIHRSQKETWRNMLLGLRDEAPMEMTAEQTGALQALLKEIGEKNTREMEVVSAYHQCTRQQKEWTVAGTTED